jgi:hypothetical protein
MLNMVNIDLKKTLKQLYAPSAKDISIVNLPPMNYLMIDGAGNPNTAPAYQQAVEALYSLAYAVRAISKASDTVFTVMPLEGLWSFEGEPNETFNITAADKERFIWTMMILQPEMVTAEMVAQAQQKARQKATNGLLATVRFEQYAEGEAVQIMHLGPYSAEGPTVARLHNFVAEKGWKLSKKHHEIYLSDPRKVAPEKMKTIIRQPFART